MIRAEYLKFPLQFKRPSGTSRGILNSKDSWIIKLSDSENPQKMGFGECSVIPGLSYDDLNLLPEKIEEVVSEINSGRVLNVSDLSSFPALQFALETAFLDFKEAEQGVLFNSDFTSGKDEMQINGLIWMGEHSFMKEQIEEKIKQGFKCIKLKIGAINFEEEIDLLKRIRKEYSSKDIEIRVDANGAFETKDALEKLKVLSDLDLHSIEQPIKQGQIEEMRILCEQTPLPIALDEELIGVIGIDKREDLLSFVKPQYIILKPSLVGGIYNSREWINLAKELNIGWWITSALESNIGLNAIAQWTYTLNNPLPQGLGTGQLFTNNIDSPLELKGDRLRYSQEKKWNFDQLW